MKNTIFAFTLTLFSLCLFAQTKDDNNKRNYINFGLEMFQAKDTHLHGFKKDGKVVIKPEYVYVEDFSPKGFARVRIPGPNNGYVQGLYPFYETLYLSNEGLDGFIDTLGNVIIPIEFGVVGLLDHSNIAEFTRGRLIDSKDGTGSGRSEKYGLINDKGEVVLEPTYDLIYPVTNPPPFLLFRATNFICDIDGKTTYKDFFLNAQGELLAPNGKYDFIDYLHEDSLLYVERQGMAGIINDRLEVVLPLEHEIIDMESTKKRLIEIYNAKKEVLNSLSQKENIVQ